MAGNILNLKKEADIHVQETQRAPKEMNPKISTPRRTIIKMAKVKDKERILKTSKRKIKSHVQGSPHRSISDFSAETLQAIREWHDIFKLLKGKNLQPRILYPAGLSFRFGGSYRTF